MKTHSQFVFLGPPSKRLSLPSPTTTCCPQTSFLLVKSPKSVHLCQWKRELWTEQLHSRIKSSSRRLITLLILLKCSASLRIISLSIWQCLRKDKPLQKQLSLPLISVYTLLRRIVTTSNAVISSTNLTVRLFPPSCPRQVFQGGQSYCSRGGRPAVR